MQNIIHIISKELFYYFQDHVAYIYISTFLFLMGFLTFFFGSFFEREQLDLISFFSFHPWLYLFFIPILTMRTWNNEIKNGTLELQFSMPIYKIHIILGKFFSYWLIILIILICSFPIWCTVNFLGNPDNNIIINSYLASILLAGVYISIGMCISTLFSNNTMIYVINFIIIFFFNLLNYPYLLKFINNYFIIDILNLIINFSFIKNFDVMIRGIIDIHNIFYFISSIIFWLYLNAIMLKLKILK